MSSHLWSSAPFCGYDLKNICSSRFIALTGTNVRIIISLRKERMKEKDTDGRAGIYEYNGKT